MFKVHPEIEAIHSKLSMAACSVSYELPEGMPADVVRAVDFLQNGKRRLAAEFWIEFIGSPMHRLQTEIAFFERENEQSPSLIRVGKELRKELIRDIVATGDICSAEVVALHKEGVANSHGSLLGIKADWDAEEFSLS